MLSAETADCLALANTAILMRLTERLIDCGAITKADAGAVLRDAVSDLEGCPESSSRVDDAIKIIRNELTPRIVQREGL